MTAPRAQEPLPCPFCGRMPNVREGYGWFVECPVGFGYPRETRCSVGPCAGGYTRGDATERWNRRAQSADTRRLDWLESLTDLTVNSHRLSFSAQYHAANGASLRTVVDANMAHDAAMTQEGEAKQARESDRWLADGPDLNEEGDA